MINSFNCIKRTLCASGFLSCLVLIIVLIIGAIEFWEVKLNFIEYRKILKISPGAYFWRGLTTEGNLRFKIGWPSDIVGSKFTVLAFFYFVFQENFPSISPRGAYIWRGLYMEVLIFGNLRYSITGRLYCHVICPNYKTVKWLTDFHTTTS